MAYLKKKKMYELLKQATNTNLKMLKDSEYRFYRGAEWIKCETQDYQNFYDLYRNGCYFSLHEYQYDEETDKFEEVEHIAFRMEEGKLIKTYSRREAYDIVDEEIEQIVQALVTATISESDFEMEI